MWYDKKVIDLHRKTAVMTTRKHETIATYPNGNLAYESVARKRIDNSTTRNISERKLLWDAQNRLRGISENGYVSLYWYDVFAHGHALGRLRQPEHRRQQFSRQRPGNYHRLRCHVLCRGRHHRLHLQSFRRPLRGTAHQRKGRRQAPVPACKL